jgi:hypothetical protein
MAYTNTIINAIIQVYIDEKIDLYQFARAEILRIGEDKFIHRCIQYKCCPSNINSSDIYTIQRIFALFSRNKISLLRFYLSGKENKYLKKMCNRKGIKLSGYSSRRKNNMINLIIDRFENIIFYNI